MRFIYLLFLSSFLITSCSSVSEDKIITGQEDFGKDSLNQANHQKIVKQIFYNVPSPLEISSLLQSVGAEYNPYFLNSYKKVDLYTTTKAMALNLGVYGADLSYNRLYNQTQASIHYFSAIKRLSDNLSIPQEQGGETAERLESNLENKDSLLVIISQTYANANEYLKESDKGNLASLIILGGWIEALNIGVQIADVSEENYSAIINNIAEQKLSLGNLINLLNAYKTDEDIQKYLVILEDLKVSYDKVDISYTKNKLNIDNNRGVTTIESKSSITITKETFLEIKEKIKSIRASIII